MSNSSKTKFFNYLKECREDLQKAEKNGDAKVICLAKANLGYALIQTRAYDEATDLIEEAAEIADASDDPRLKIKYLSLRTICFQIIGRFPDAFKHAEEILELGKEIDDKGVQCDAILSLGQIMMDSGDLVVALEQFNKAKDIAEEIDDKHRQMKVYGAMGQYSIAIPALEKAQINFEKARRVAIDLDDTGNEIGFTGNISSLLSWMGKDEEAVEGFERLLEYYQGDDNQDLQLQALRHLTKVYGKLKDDEKILEYSQRGIDLIGDEVPELGLNFIELNIAALFRLNQIDEAIEKTIRALDFAKALKNESKEVDLSIGLGESFYLIKKYKKALKYYTEARVGALKLSRKKDSAYLTGRIGITYAEMGEFDKAIEYHEDAVELARERDMYGFEAEQLSMLAMAHFDLGDPKKALKFAAEAQGVYEQQEMVNEVFVAQKLIDQIKEKSA